MNVYKLSAAVFGLLAAIAVGPQRAAACFRGASGTPSVLPLTGSELPVNLLEWVATVSPTRAYKLLVTAPDGSTREVAYEAFELDPLEGPHLLFNLQRYRPGEPIAVGSELQWVRIGDADADGTEFPEDVTLVTYKVTEAAKLPATLGIIEAELTLGELRIGGPQITQCHIDVEDASFARIELQPPPELTPFESQLRYELRVDGERAWSYKNGERAERRLGTSSLGEGVDMLYLTCHGELPRAPVDTPGWLLERYQELEPGEHTIQMLARLPDGRVLSSNELDISLDCVHVGGPVPAPRSKAKRAAQASQNLEQEPEPEPPSAASCSVRSNVRPRAQLAPLALWLTALTLLCAKRRRNHD